MRRPDTAVQENCDHVRAAICNSDLTSSQSWLRINLAPANLSQEGPAYNLPVAVVVLLVSEQIFADLIRGQPV